LLSAFREEVKCNKRRKHNFYFLLKKGEDSLVKQQLYIYSDPMKNIGIQKDEGYKNNMQFFDISICKFG